MSEWTQTPAMTAAMLSGVKSRMDYAPGNAYALIYSGANILLATVVLAQPSATIDETEGSMTLVQGDDTGDLVLASGVPTRFELYASDNVLLGTGTVSAPSGAGIMKVTGSGVAGSATLYEGGRVRLVDFRFV